jgi:LysR family transcriptional activator of nhaA
MFQLGGELELMLRAQPNEQQILFRVGVADVVPKSIVYRLIAPTMELSEPLRITCREDKLERLLADLAIQRLDLVISDSPMPSNLDIKGYSQKLGECGISFFATAELAARYGQDFPHSLHGAPLLIPGPETVVRSRLQRWFAEQQIQPRIVGEFDDSALMQAFGQSGSGIFIGPSVIADEVKRQCDVELIGQTDAVRESFYAISVERKVKHPGIVAITEGARRELFVEM